MKRRTHTLSHSSLLALKSVYTAYAVDCHTLPIWHVTYNADNKRVQSPSRRRGATAILRLARGLTSARARSGIPRHSGNCYRPVIFSNATAKVEMAYDYMGRRFEYKETVNNILTRHERYLYRGYLQLAALDMINSGSVKHTIAWDPKESTATRPLALQIDANSYYYSFDQVKNVTELFDSTGALAATYDYTPFGQIASFQIMQSGNNAITQFSNPLTFSSEVQDFTLGLQYYNYRHLNSLDGRWVNRDPIGENGGENVYSLLFNRMFKYFDHLGLSVTDSIEYVGELSYTDFVERYKNTKLKFPAPGVVGCAEVFISGSVTFERCPPPKQNCSKTVIRKDTEMQGQIFWIGDRADSCDIAVHEFTHINHGHQQARLFDKFLHTVADGKIVKNRCAYSKRRLVDKAEKYIQSKLDLIDIQFDYDQYGKDIPGWEQEKLEKAKTKSRDAYSELQSAVQEMVDACANK